LLLFSVVVQDGLDRRPVEGDACNPPVDEAYTPTDMNFSAIRSIKISSMDFSIALRSPDMHARDQISRVGERVLKVRKMGGKVSKAQCNRNQFSVSSVCKSVPDEAFDGINRKHHNIFLQQTGIPQSIPYGMVSMIQW
jgi:hypothetical protein